MKYIYICENDNAFEKFTFTKFLSYCSYLYNSYAILEWDGFYAILKYNCLFYNFHVYALLQILFFCNKIV